MGYYHRCVVPLAVCGWSCCIEVGGEREKGEGEKQNERGRLKGMPLALSVGGSGRVCEREGQIEKRGKRWGWRNTLPEQVALINKLKTIFTNFENKIKARK
jgi:hypothetical protein